MHSDPKMGMKMEILDGQLVKKTMPNVYDISGKTHLQSKDRRVFQKGHIKSCMLGRLVENILPLMHVNS